jgi:aminotransferase
MRRFGDPRLWEIETPVYRRFLSKVRMMEGVLSLLAGDPDFSTPSHIREAAMKALEEGWTHYPAWDGYLDLRSALADYHSQYGTDWRPETEVRIYSGSTPALFTCFLALLRRGDGIVVFEPYYMGYSPVFNYMNLKLSTVTLKEEERFHPDIEELKEAIKPETKMIVLCTPNNPTGTVYGEEELKAIADLAVDHDLLVLSDEIYDQFIYEGKHRSIAALPDMRERTLVILSFSKTFAMTGWRLGAVLADKEVLGLIRRVPIGGRPAAFIQRAGLAALKGPWEPVERFREEFKKRRDYLAGRLNEIEGVSCTLPEGAFYLFPNISDICKDSVEFCEGLLGEEKVAVYPGIAYGKTGEGHVRIALVKPIGKLDRCAEAFENYAKKRRS